MTCSTPDNFSWTHLSRTETSAFISYSTANWKMVSLAWTWISLLATHFVLAYKQWKNIYAGNVWSGISPLTASECMYDSWLKKFELTGITTRQPSWPLTSLFTFQMNCAYILHLLLGASIFHSFTASSSVTCIFVPRGKFAGYERKENINFNTNKALFAMN